MSDIKPRVSVVISSTREGRFGDRPAKWIFDLASQRDDIEVEQSTYGTGRTVSWQISIPRSKRRSSTFRSDSGKRTYIITTSRITSGDELKYRNGLADLLIRRR